LRQFFLDTTDGAVPVPGQEVVLDAEESHHLFTVLRGGRDQVLNLTDGRGRRFTGRPVAQDRRRARVEILTVAEDPAEALLPQLVLACAVVKGKRFEWALEKAVEVGAHRIIPLRTEFGVIEPGGGKRQRWLTIMKSAVKQCGRSWLPELGELHSPAELLAPGGGSACWSDLALYGTAPWEKDQPIPWQDLLAAAPDPLPATLGFLVGPEGGWSPAELALLQEGPARAVLLGPHVLRAETAAVVGLGALQTLRQSWTRGSAVFSE
jgi:16S rRNA (uracil1498-N3)-methyltransferase